MRFAWHLRRWWNDATPRERAIGVLRDLPRWLFLAALIYAPWHYGGTTETSIRNINFVLAAVVVLWLIELVVRRRKLVIPPVLLVAAILILSLGWLVTFNARSVHDTEFEMFAPVHRLLSWAPSSVDGLISATAMVRVSCLLGILLFVADLSRRSQWLLRIWVTVGIAGGSIALLGLMQRATGAVLPYWEFQAWEENSFFATYYYHGNAGAFLNLVFAPTAGLALRAFRHRDAAIQRAIWTTATLLLMTAILANSSRGAQFIGLATFIALAVGAGKGMRRLGGGGNRAALALAGVVVAVALIVIAQVSGITQGLERWHRVGGVIPADLRWQAYKAAFAAVPDASWAGFGPGTFNVIFPHYEQTATLESGGRWEFLHQDYLQTILEWGWAGAACWAVILFGGIGAGVVVANSVRRLQPAPRVSRILPLFLIAIAATALHAFVDFPLQIASLQLYFLTYVGVCWGSLDYAQSANRRPTRLARANA
jgi:hypothetical protein